MVGQLERDSDEGQRASSGQEKGSSGPSAFISSDLPTQEDPMWSSEFFHKRWGYLEGIRSNRCRRAQTGAGSLFAPPWRKNSLRPPTHPPVRKVSGEAPSPSSRFQRPQVPRSKGASSSIGQGWPPARLSPSPESPDPRKKSGLDSGSSCWRPRLEERFCSVGRGILLPGARRGSSAWLVGGGGGRLPLSPVQMTRSRHSRMGGGSAAFDSRRLPHPSHHSSRGSVGSGKTRRGTRSNTAALRGTTSPGGGRELDKARLPAPPRAAPRLCCFAAVHQSWLLPTKSEEPLVPPALRWRRSGARASRAKERQEPDQRRSGGQAARGNVLTRTAEPAGRGAFRRATGGPWAFRPPRRRGDRASSLGRLLRLPSASRVSEQASEAPDRPHHAGGVRAPCLSSLGS